MPKICLVTGASSDLGQTLVSALTSTGHFVYSPRSSELDITSDLACHDYVGKIIKKHHRIDILINVAGVSPSGPVELFSASDMGQVLDVNAIGPFRLTSLVLPYMIKQRSGRIINIASLSGLVGFPNFSIYSASKFALRGWGLSAHHELAPRGICVTTVFPGALTSTKKIPPGSARSKVPFLKWLFPLTPPSAVVDPVMASLTTSTPPAEIMIGRDTMVIYGLFRFLPGQLWHKLQQYIWKKQR